MVAIIVFRDGLFVDSLIFMYLLPDYQWLHNIEEESKKKKNKNHVRSEEEDVVQLPAGAGMLAPFDADRHQRQRTRKPGDGHECKYSPKFTNGECELCWKEHEFCNLMTNSRCKVCYRQAENCPSSETKSFYVVQKLMKLYEANKQRQASMSKGMVANGFLFREKRPLKIIVFSQFRKVLNLTGDRLLRRFGTACIAEYWGKFRKQELSKFIHDDECFCMLLGKDGSEGLDLSFVTHIFFLEQVWDKSLEQQAVARAWRMGAKGSVEVETLVAENSVEQTMSRLEQKLEEDTDEGISLDDIQGIQMANEAEKISEYQRAKLQFLLRGLKLITNAHTTSFGTAKRKELTATEDTYTIRPPANKKPRKLRVRFQNF